MDTESILNYILALVLLSGLIHCDPRQNDGTLYTLYNNRRGENTVIRVHPDRKIEPAYGYPSSDQEALYRYQLYNGGLTPIDFSQPEDDVYVFRKDLAGQPVIPAQPVSLQQQAGPTSVDQAAVSIAQLQQQKQLQQSQQQLQPTQQQLALQKQREQQLTLQNGSPQQAPHPQQATANPLPAGVYGILIKQEPNQVSASKSREEKPVSSPLLRPESQIVAQTIPQQQGPANNVRSLPSGLRASNGLPVLPPIFGVHDGVLGKVPLPFPNVPAYGISQYGGAPQKQASIGNEYLNAPPPAPQKETNENLSLRAPNAQINTGAQLANKETSDKQLPIRNLGVTRTQVPPQSQSVYFDDEKIHKLAPSILHKNPDSRRHSSISSREPSNIRANQPNGDDQLKLLSSYQNQQRSSYQDSLRGAVSPLEHTNSQQRDITKLSNRPSQVEPASYLPQSQQDSTNYPAANSYKEQTQINKPRIRNQNEQYPLGHDGERLGISDDDDFDDDYSEPYREVRPRNKDVSKKIPANRDSPTFIQETISTTTLPPTPKPIESVSDAPTQSDYSQNYDSSDSSQDDEDDNPPSHFFSDEDRFGSRISKSAQPETPFVQQTTITQAQPSALLSAQLSVQESQSSFPAAALTPTQTPNRIGVGHFQQPPRGLNTGGSNIDFPQSARNILPQAQLQNAQNTAFQRSYNVQQQIPLEQNLPKRDHVQRGATPYSQEAVNQNSNDFRNQYEKRPILTQQGPESAGFLPARQQSGDDLEKKQTEEVPKRQRGRRRKNKQRSNRNRQPTVKTINNEQQTSVKEINAPIPQYQQQQQQQQYGGGQAQYPPQQPLQNIPPNLNNRPGALSPSLGYPTQNQQSNINLQQSDSSYPRGNSNDPSQYFARNNGPQLQNNRLPITPNLVSYPEVTTKPSNSYLPNQKIEPNKNAPRQSAYGHPLPQQHHPQYNIPPPLNTQSNYQNSPPNNYPSSYNIPTGNSASSHLSNNAPQAQNPPLYRQESVPHHNIGNYRSDLSQQSSAYDVSGIQQNRGKVSQQSSLSTEEDKPVPSLSQATTTPPPHQEATTSRSTTRSRFGQRRKGRGRSRQQKSRSRNTIKEERPQDQPEDTQDKGQLQSQPLQQQGPAHNPRTSPHTNQQFNPTNNSPRNQQQLLPQNVGYNSQADSKPKQSFLQQAPPPLNLHGGQQLTPTQHNKVPQQYNTPQQSYNNQPQQLPNYHYSQKQPELGANLPPNGPSSQLPYHTGYGQQQPQLPNVNIPQQPLSSADNNPYPFQPNYGQGPLQVPRGNYQDTIQQNGESQFYKRADAEDAAVDDDYVEDGELDNDED